jgi:hypothetical protein
MCKYDSEHEFINCNANQKFDFKLPDFIISEIKGINTTNHNEFINRINRINIKINHIKNNILFKIVEEKKIDIDIKKDNKNIKEPTIDKEENNCAICLGKYESPSVIIKCGHVYCTACIDIFTKNAHQPIMKCPKCKINISLTDIKKLYF